MKPKKSNAERKSVRDFKNLRILLENSVERLESRRELLFKNNRICKHVTNFKTSPPSLRMDVINVWSLIGKNFKKSECRDWRLQRLDLLRKKQNVFL